MSEHPDTITKLKSKAPQVLVILIAAIILTAGFFAVRQTKYFVDATTHQPERYTELYFSNPTALPVHVSHGSTLAVSFTVHNVEARSMAYDYSVSYITDAGQVLAQKLQSLNLQSNQRKTIVTPLIIPSDYIGRAEIQVSLQNLKNQSIHFWVKAV